MNIKEDAEFIELEKRVKGFAVVQCIETEEELQSYLEKQGREAEQIKKIFPDSERLYRGQYSASWTCESSLLRCFRELYPDCTKDKIENVFSQFYDKNRKLWQMMLAPEHNQQEVTKLFFSEMEIRENESWSKFLDKTAKGYKALSEELNAAWRECAAQHYGLPTGMLDFTKDVYVALYFATKMPEDWKDKEGLNSYCSIMQFDTKNEIKNWEDIRAEHIDILRAAFSYCEDNNIPMATDYSESVQEMNIGDDSSSLDDISIPVYFDRTEVRNIANRRIDKQRGVLLCLGKNRCDSLEKSFAKNRNINPQFPELSIVIINRKLNECMQKILKEKSISDDTMGFKTYRIGN